MTVATDLVHPDIKKVLLAEITCGQQLRSWTLDTGTTYYATADYNIIDVEEDGTSLTSQSSVANVDANAGSYYYDSSNTRVYVHTTASADAHTVTIQAMLQFYYSDAGKIANNQFYESRLISIPTLDLRVEQKFTGISQISGGNISLSNADGHFDKLVDFNWNAGAVAILLGTELNGVIMPYVDYQTMGTFLINNWSISDTKFVLSISEYKIKIKKKIPTDFYDRKTYPNIENSDIGRPIQIGYGIIYGAQPALINISTRTFKVAGHAINEYIQVRVLNENNGAWDIKSFATTDLANGEFTLSASDWTYNQKVSVDFKGKEKTTNVVMDNASDVVKDILETYLGESASIDSTSFTTAYNRLYGGTIFKSTDLKTHRALGVYIWETETVSDIIEKINISIGSYLFADTAGKFVYKVFWPSKSEGLTKFDLNNIIDFSEDTSNDNIFAKCVVNYAMRHTRDWSQFAQHTHLEYQYLHNQKSVILTEIDSLLYEQDDAEILSERVINYEGKPLKSYNLTVPARDALLLLPGDAVRVVYPRHDINGVYEVLQVNHNLTSATSRLMLGDSHGLKDEAGFWVLDADRLPVRFANEAGYNTGLLAWNDSWSDAIATWASQNVGYWTDSNGYASSTDNRSLLKSTWI